MKESTTIKVLKDTSRLLEDLRAKMNARNLDEVVQRLIAEWRMKMLDEAFGLDRGKVKPFTEGDRGEDRG